MDVIIQFLRKPQNTELKDNIGRYLPNLAQTNKQKYQINCHLIFLPFILPTIVLTSPRYKEYRRIYKTNFS